jgi:hypothetical protein
MIVWSYKIDLHHVVKQLHNTQWRRKGGEDVLLLLIHDLATRLGVSGQRHAPTAVYPRGKDPWYPLDRRLGGPQSWSGHRG